MTAIMDHIKNSNSSIIQMIEDELPKSTVYYLLIAIVMAQAWTVYLSYYHSRVLGLIITAFINKFVKYGHIRLGSFSFSVLSGKIMFREVHLITEDFSFRVQFGWIIFRWWRPYIYKELSEDFSHSDTRMSLFLDGVEFHVYNRSSNYSKMEKLFGLSPDAGSEQVSTAPGAGSGIKVPENADGLHWRDLIPVTKITINSGRVIFGNYLVPYTLIGSFEEGHLIYTTKPASTPFDKFMHVLKCKVDNMKVMLVPSPKFTGPTDDEPPRFMGEGFVILQSRDVDIYFYMDEPGVVPHEPELMEMADGEVVVRRTYPCMGVDIKCGRNTDFNYGPWVDRQREHLWKFFYPPDYQAQVPSVDSEPGEKRNYKTFEVKLIIISAATFDILFTKNSETQAVHMNTGQGSYIEAIIPWMIEEKGYTTKVKGQLMLLDMTTSMTFRSLVECETFEFEVSGTYPIVWNEHQDWRLDFTACKAIVYLIFEHKNFFRDLSDDWSTKSRPDIYSFIPYTWTVNLTVKQFELLTLANEYNWIDTSSQHPENAHIAFCGENMDLSLQLPFVDFLPVTLPIQFVIKGETVDCRLYLPESNTSRHVVIALAENMKIFDRDGNPTDKPFAHGKQKPWRKVTTKSTGWVDCWSTSHVLLSIRYTYHPMAILGTPVSSKMGLDDLPTPDREESLLMPLRPLCKPECSNSRVTPETFDAAEWDPDVFSVELEVAPSVLCLYGSLFRYLINVKENYLGEDQKVADFKADDSSPESEDRDSSFVNITASNTEKNTSFDPRAYRPFAVTVSVILQDIQAHLVRNCGPDDIASPCARVERLCFELDKSYLETKLQLLLSPSVLIARDNLVRDADQDHLKEGHLALSGLQVRGHAMFSHVGLPLDCETLEYAWLVEAVIGEVTGRLTAPQVQNVAEFLQTFVLLIDDPENKLKRPTPWGLCQHMLPQPTCRMLPSCPFPCPSSDDIKYRLVRASVDSVNLFIVESGAALNLWVSSVRISTCNLHGNNTRSGITCVVDQVTLKQHISCAPLRLEPGHPEMWLDAGGFSFGPLNVEAAMALPNSELHYIQDHFLHMHDKKTRRLWFLWPVPTTHAGQNANIAGKCGCLGGCVFFGKNKNGTTFFKSRRHREHTNVAIPQVFPEGVDPGFAQSLLHKDKLVFDVGHSLKSMTPKMSPTEFSFTRGYMSDVASPDTPGVISSTLMDSLLMGGTTDHGELDSSRDNTLTSDITSVRSNIRGSWMDGRNMDAYADPKVKDSSSVSIHFVEDRHSIESATLRRQTSITASTCSSSPSSPSVPRQGSTLSGGSVDSTLIHSTTSKSSIPSPVPIHRIAGSATAMDKLMSTVSLESDRYYSAEEDVLSLSEADSQQQYHSLLSEITDSPNSPCFDIPGFPFGHDKTIDATVLEQKGYHPNMNDLDYASSASSSTSTLSYTSAPTDHESETMSGEAPEEFSLIDLHSQMNQPITKSPLLLSRYSSHLSHYNCHDWVAPPPIHSAGKSIHSLQSEHSLSSASQSVYGSAALWIPHFSKVRQGFSTSVMKEKSELKLPSPPGPRRSEAFDWSRIDEQNHEEEDNDDKKHLENTSKTTAVIKVAGTFDILVTPLLLESLQRYIEAVTPCLASMHPSALIDRLHSHCLDQLKQQNNLKKGQTGNPDDQDQPADFHPTLSQKSSTDRRTSDVVKTSSLQAFFSLPKINLCVMQASLVEEVISFAVLDNINDLTAVSLMAVCVDGIKCQLLSNTHHCKKLTGDPGPRRTSTTPVQQRTRHDSSDTEQSIEHTREENVGTLKLNRIHCQLRRLLKHSNFSDNVVLTAIPEHRSNVLFTFDQDGSSSVSHVPVSPRKRLSRQASRDSRDGGFDATIGVIMFECGLEEVSVTAVRRLGYKDTMDMHLQQKMDNIEKALQELQECTREEIEQLTESGTSPTDHEPMSSPSSHHSSESMSSWDSRLSLASNVSGLPPPTPEPLQGDASNGRLRLKTIWLSFAAPPPISIKKKVDFTRLDWNLLSTATPAINAWLNPCDRAMLSVKHLVSELTKRNSSVMACIMTQALEEQGIHVCNKSKFGKMTSLSKTLQDEPSSQLLTVLRKYLHIHGCGSIERAVLSETAPQLITMQKGILALTRQWKNVLYMPYMSDIHFKSKKSVRPYNVTFSIPKPESSENLCTDDGEGTIEQFDVVDEKTSLLQAEGGLVMKSTSNPSLISRGGPSSSAAGRVDHGHDGVSTVSTSSFQPKKFLATVRSRGRGAFPNPVLSCMDSPDRKVEQTQTAATLSPPTAIPRNDSNFSFISAADSISSIDQAIASTPPHTPLRTSGQKQLHLKNRYSKITDMYQWMTAQQEDFKDPLDDGTNYGRTHENMSTGFGSAWSQDDSRTDVNEEYLTMATSIMQLADAQLLFRPLLQSLGLHVEGVRPSAMMKKFGGHLLLQANLDILKIQIAESEASYSKGSHKGKGKSKKYRLNMNAGNSAFSCEGFGVNISMKDVVDFGQKDAGVGGRSKRFPWKFAMHKLEAKPTTLQVNFLIKCQAITQHVDMALLRLVHQVVTMVDNIKETQVELKQRRSGFEWVKTHRKQESKDSTSSADTQQSDLSKVDQPSAETQISTPDQSLCSDTLIQESEKHVAKTPKSVSSFRLALDSKRPDKLPLTSSSKKSQLRFAKEPKRRSDITVTPSQHSEVLTPPQSLNLSDSVTMDLVDTSSPALAEKTIVDEIKESTPQCWRHLYHLLELYSTMPEPKTVLRKPGMQKLPIIEEEEPESEMKRDNSKLGSGSLKRDSSKMGSGITLQDEDGKIPDMGNEEQDIGVKGPSLAQTSFIRTRFKQSIYIGESIPLVVYGIAKIEKVQVLAVLSGLKLEAELRRVHASGTYKERVKGFLHRKSSDSSFTAHVGHTMIVLLEGVPPSMQTVVTVNIRKSQALHTTVMRRAKEHNSALASIGHIDIDIPQHPVVLHGMMTRSSRQLTSTLQEFGWPLSRTANKPPQPDVVDGEVKEEVKKEQTEQSENKAPGKPRRTGQPPPPSVSKPVTLHIHFKTVFQGITTAASILPSLKAQHKTGSITVAGMTGKKARFTVVLPKHTLSFRSKVVTTETSIPSSASIELPPIHVYADYRQHKAGAPVSETLTEGLILKAGSYMNAVAEVGMLEHSLTTDLLNHLVFVQKVFMKEVNEVVQKVSGSDQPMRLWSEEEKSTQAGDPEPLLYSFSFRFKGIQITATTPTSNAVRLETGEIELEVSNRVHMAARESQPDLDYEDNQKVFIRAQIYLNVALGQLLKNQVFEEAEPEFQTMAFFKTKIGIRNALQDEMIPGVSTNQEALIINLSRPIVLAQPLAFDKAVLVWLNYKNAYEYWTEQRMSLNKEVQTATQEVINKLPQFAQAAAAPSLSTLFLQLTVDDMGICVPIDTLSYQVPTGPGLGRMAESDPGAALVLTIESSQISACSSGSLVSKGRFKGFSFRFADDFETSWDDWKPNGKEEPNMNICCVPEGTYEVCSRTINKQASDPRSNAKWILNVQWQMQGIDVHLDTNIGKRLTALGHNLTALAGEAEAGFGTGFGMQEDETDGLDNEATDTEIDDPVRRPSLVSDILPEELLSQDLDPKERARQIEREMNEQAKVVQDLKQLGATLSIIEAERRKLEELQAILFHDFRRDVFNKLKKQSERASAIRDKLGLNPKPAHSRSKSYGGHHGKRKDHQGESSRVTSYTMDPRRQARTHSIDLAAISPSGHVARVQFGATRSNTYTPPGTPDAMTSSFDETDLPLLQESVSLQDLTSDSDLPSSTDSDTPDSQINLDTVFRRRPSRTKRKLKTSSNPSIGSGIASKTSAAEPNIDFELDVKVFIDSGKCVLYPKEARDEEVKRQQKRERNLSGEQTASPVMRRKLKRQESSSTLLQAKKSIVPPQVPVVTTVFYLPSVDVKVHYYSKTTLAELVHSTGSISDGERMFSSSVDRPDLTAQASTDVFTTQSDGNWDSVDNCSNVSILSRRGAVKKANLYAWLSLQKLPESPVKRKNKILRQREENGKKNRLGSGPVASSTPMTRVYDFSDGEDDGQDLLRRASSCRKSIPYAEFLQLMRVMEGRLHRAITDLKGEVGDLKKEIGNLNSEVRDLKSKLTEKNTQVTALTAKVTRLDNRVQEPTQTSTKSSKVSTNIRAALKAAIDHAETEKGWTMEPMFTLESAQNRQVVKYIWDFSKVIAPSMTKQEFKDGMTRIMLTKKEKLSRTRNGKEKEHTDASRKNSRKLTEMIISPCLLDFLEQALEPLPFSAPLHKKDLMGSVLNMDLDASQASLGSPVSMASFPVDVVVYIKVEPSVIRFNCRPISRVECLLQVPSLELVFSTKKSDLDGSIAEGTPPMKAKIPKRSHEWLPSNSTSSRSRLGSTLSECSSSSTHSGGLSVTGCLSDFSLYVFHPYGGGQRRLGSIQEHAGGGVLEMSRKDSLSLNVEFIKVNISRSRKMELRGASENSLSGNKEAQMKSNVVRFSAICDIGTASFKYDMRRLSEILSLPKAWYRRNLARRLFLGDESIVHTGADAEVDATLSSNRPTLSTQASLSFPSLTVVEENEPFRLTHHRRVSSGDKVKIQISSDLKNEIYQKSSRRGSSVPQSPTEGGGSNVTPKLGAPGARKSRAYSSPDTGRHRSSSAPPAPTSRSSKWETLVLFAVNLSRLDVDVNMSNVMGNTLWSTRELKSHGRLSIDSSGHKNLKITGGLGGSSFESRGGVVGGAIDLLSLQTFFHVTEDPELGKDPDHRAGLTLEAIEGRVDYMGSSVLMTRLSLLDLLLRDEWHVESDTHSDTPLATKRSAYLFVNGDLHWEQFHLMISRSTTPDLIKLVAKLDEFFTQQLTSSKRVLSAFGPIPPRNRTTSQRKLSEDILSELRHHRHWQGALEQLVGCNFRMLPQILPSEGMILGGTVTLQGENLSLASFHGINFRSKSWAIFNIREPYIYFSTEAQKTPDRGTHVVQDLTFIIGHKLTKGGTSSQPPPNSSAPHMATICKVSRGHYVPQQFTSVQEWFNYAFSSSDMKDIDSFPSVRREHCESPTEHRKSRKPQAYNHESEMIFAFPSLYMNLKTFHYQGEHEPQNDDPQPVVESSFVTEFYDHIFVAMDAEVILFLHDLVSSYIKEKDKGARSSYGQASKAAKATDLDKKKLTDPTEALKQDYRDFHCKTWQLEPTVRLLHWASKQIDPVGVDFVLQKLGFSHARVTIPKWMQRGVMDPLDKILSMLVNSLVVALKDQQDRDVVDDVD